MKLRKGGDIPSFSVMARFFIMLMAISAWRNVPFCNDNLHDGSPHRSSSAVSVNRSKIWTEGSLKCKRIHSSEHAEFPKN